MGKAKFPHPINYIEVYWLISRRLKNRHWGMEVFLKGESVEGGERLGCMALDTREKLNKKWANKVPLGRQGRVGRSSKEGGMIVVTPPAGWSIQKSHFFLFAWRFFMISVLGGGIQVKANISQLTIFVCYRCQERSCHGLLILFILCCLLLLRTKEGKNVTFKQPNEVVSNECINFVLLPQFCNFYSFIH